jgi:hypothetical protein
VLFFRTLVVVLVTSLFGQLQPAEASSKRPAFSCAEDGASPDVVIPLRISNQTTLATASVDAITDFAGIVWRRYGVHLERSQEGRAAIGVIIAPTVSPQMAHDGLRVLASTIFDHGEATSTMYVWVGSAEALMASAPGYHGSATLPKGAQDAGITQMLGVAFAHEIGHYLLDTADHSATGLLRANIPVTELLEPNLRALRLDRAQQVRLCRGLDRRQTIADAAAPAWRDHSLP